MKCTGRMTFMTEYVAIDPHLRSLMIQSAAALLQDRIEAVSQATRARLAEAALDLREDAESEAFGCDIGLIAAARRLEAICSEAVR